MKDRKIEINDYYELLNLHKALLEARFHQGIDNKYLAASPIISGIHARVIECLALIEKDTKGYESWSEWIKITNRKDYLDIAIESIIRFEEWNNSNNPRNVVKKYISPFIASEEELDSIIQIINARA